MMPCNGVELPLSEADDDEHDDPAVVGDVGTLQSILEDYLEVDRYQVGFRPWEWALQRYTGTVYGVRLQ